MLWHWMMIEVSKWPYLSYFNAYNCDRSDAWRWNLSFASPRPNYGITCISRSKLQIVDRKASSCSTTIQSDNFAIDPFSFLTNNKSNNASNILREAISVQWWRVGSHLLTLFSCKFLTIRNVTISSLFSLRESYAYVLLDRKAKRLRKETGNLNLRSVLDTGRSPKELFLFSIVRPTKMLFLSPIVFLLSLYTQCHQVQLR